MQDRYAGDIGDFLKFSLLRQLRQPSEDEPGLRLGVVWYLAPDEDHNLDGKHTPYLDSPKPRDRVLTALDPDLAQRLRTVVHGHRSVQALEAAEVLPPGTHTFNRRLSFS